MAKVQKQSIIDDVILQVTQGAPSQDFEGVEQISYWASIEANYLIAAEIAQALKKGLQVPPIYIKREPVLPLKEEITPIIPQGDDGSYQRYYVNLSSSILDVPDDNGVVVVLTSENEEINKTSLLQQPMLSAMRYSKASSQVLTWSRQGDTLFIEGWKESDLQFNFVTVHYVPKLNFEALKDTDLVSISDALLPVLINNLVIKAKIQLYGTQADNKNNSIQDADPVYGRQVQGSQEQQPTDQQ